jgi:aminoglycoside phosphotransferase (APT) family kinase protein
MLTRSGSPSSRCAGWWIGGELLARMPKIARAVDQADSDARWLPALGPRLPVRIPVPLHLGEPGAGYPWRWTVVPWIAGSTPPRLGCDDVPLARDVAAFARALHGVDLAGGPVQPPGSRGSALRHAPMTASAGCCPCSPGMTTAST